MGDALDLPLTTREAGLIQILLRFHFAFGLLVNILRRRCGLSLRPCYGIELCAGFIFRSVGFGPSFCHEARPSEFSDTNLVHGSATRFGLNW
jgi:hypothetical protein